MLVDDLFEMYIRKQDNAFLARFEDLLMKDFCAASKYIVSVFVRSSCILFIDDFKMNLFRDVFSLSFHSHCELLNFAYEMTLIEKRFKMSRDVLQIIDCGPYHYRSKYMQVFGDMNKVLRDKDLDIARICATILYSESDKREEMRIDFFNFIKSSCLNGTVLF